MFLPSGTVTFLFTDIAGSSRTALPRQQTLRALIDWSYGLLSEQEKALLCRLSVFAGDGRALMLEQAVQYALENGENIAKS